MPQGLKTRKPANHRRLHSPETRRGGLGFCPSVQGGENSPQGFQKFFDKERRLRCGGKKELPRRGKGRGYISSKSKERNGQKRLLGLSGKGMTHTEEKKEGAKVREAQVGEGEGLDRKRGEGRL